jgi:CP family cyanate transporter-like MFS transporter
MVRTAAVPSPRRSSDTASKPALRAAPLLLGLFLAAVVARPQLVGVGPLITDIEDDLGLTHAVAGLLGAVPVLCMGLFAPFGGRLVARLGAAAGVGVCIVGIGVAGLARAAAPEAALIIALTFVVGVGMALMGSAMPVAVAAMLRDRRTLATAVYVGGINVGSTVSSAAAVPLDDALGGWRPALAAMSGATLAFALVWLVSVRAAGAVHIPRAEADAPRTTARHLRDRRVWLLVALFALLAVCFYGAITWLAASYEERGWTEGRAGALVAVFNLASLPGALLTPLLTRSSASRRAQVTAAGLCYVAGFAVLAAVPGLAWAGAVAAGFANGALFVLLMVLPVDRSGNPTEVASIAGIMLGVGYTLAAVAPVALGGLRDVSGGFGAVQLVLLASAVLIVVCARHLPRGGGEQASAPGAVSPAPAET